MNGGGQVRLPVRPLRHIAMVCASLLIGCATIVNAATAVRLPTNGYVRPGRFFPVELHTDAPVHLSADGCLRCDVAATGRVTVPMLAIGAPGELRGGDGSPLPLRVPADDERLVGTTVPLPAGTAELFPNAHVVPVRLDPADPLPGPPVAWEVLDGVVLDPMGMAAVTPEARSALLGAGVTLVVTGSDEPPDVCWPWQRRGPLWVLAYAPSGPVGEVVVPDAYGPIDGWTPSWPAAVRGTVAVTGLLLATATIALLIVRSRRLIAAAIALPLVTAIGVAGWRATLDPVARGGGDVVVVTSPGRWFQRDAWAYERARSPADVKVAWKGSTHPMFASESTFATDTARLTVAVDGSLAFAMHLPALTAIAFVRRDVKIADSPVATDGRDSMMRAIAPLYLSTGDRVAGETIATPSRWPGVAIVRGR